MSAPTIGQLGKYQLVGVLGSGGMGTVYLGRSPGGRSVAVKAVHGHLALNPDFRSRFRREVALARRVGGPFTAALLDADPEHDPPWLATEYINGRALSQVLTEHGALPERTVRALAAGLAEALGVIHAAGVIHRDLKPSNVLLSENGPRVIDFGIAKAVEGIDLTGDGPLLGTPGYMSPEHLAGRPLAPSSDVFSLGTVLAHAATGIAPFGAGQSFAVANRVSTAPPDLSQVPSGLVELIRPCLAKDPAGRPSLGWLLAQVGAFTAQAAWLPSEVGDSIRTRPTPTLPLPESGPVGGTPPSAAAGAQTDAPPLDFVAYLADRFARREGGAPVGRVGSPAAPAPAKAPPPAASRPAPGPQRPIPGQYPGPPPGSGQRPPPVPGQQRPGPDLRSAADRLRTPRRLPWRRPPWRRLQCPPLGTPKGRRIWSRWLLLLIVVGLLDAVAQSPLLRDLLASGGLTAPPWLSGAFEVSATIRKQTDWLPDPVTNWVTADGAATAGMVASRLAAVPLLLLACVALVRRSPGPTELPGRWSWSLAATTAAGWIGTLVAALLLGRYLATGFASLLWAVATLRWWTLLALPALTLLTHRATHRRQHR